MAATEQEKSPYRFASRDELNEGLTRLTVNGTELVVVHANNSVTVFGGECLHEGALMADGFIEGKFLFCAKHLWRYNIESGELDKEPGVGLKKFTVWQEGGELFIDLNEVEEMAELEDEFDSDFYQDDISSDFGDEFLD